MRRDPGHPARQDVVDDHGRRAAGAIVGHDQRVGQGIAGVDGVRRRSLHHLDVRGVGGDGRGVVGRGDRVGVRVGARGIGDVGHRAGGQVGQGNAVARGAGGGRTGGQRGDRAALVAGLVVVDHQVVDGDVAGVGDQEAVADDIVDQGVGGRRRRFDDGQRAAGSCRDGLGVGRRCDRVRTRIGAGGAGDVRH